MGTDRSQTLSATNTDGSVIGVIKMTISYLTMRRCIGVLALAFPIILIIFGGFPMQTSISATYWTNSNVLFTSILVTMGIFLISYNGYDKKDKWITSISGVALIGVALFPCEVGINPVTNAYLFSFLSPKVNAIFHYGFAIITFSFMGIMSLIQFTKSTGPVSANKKKRNLIYKICGYVIFGILFLALILELIPNAREITDTIRLWYWLEALIVWTFGISWIIKGETLWADR